MGRRAKAEVGGDGAPAQAAQDTYVTERLDHLGIVTVESNGGGATLTWSDGTPHTSATNAGVGVYLAGLNNGFQITAPADTSTRTLRVYVSCWEAQARMSVSLSDGSAAIYVNAVFSAPNGTAAAGVFMACRRPACRRWKGVIPISLG